MIRKKLIETLSPEQKVDMWHDGTRRVNVALCSPDKLLLYYNIAKSKNYRDICEIIAKYVGDERSRKFEDNPELVTATYQDFFAAEIARAEQERQRKEEEKRKEAEERERNRPLNQLIAIAESKKPRVVTNGMTDQEIADWEEALFHDLVPGSGQAATVAGEILSAWNYGSYRLFNDGDWWYGFGSTYNQSSRRAARYLSNNEIYLGRASEYARDESDFIRMGNKLILNKIFKDKLYEDACHNSWRDTDYR